MSVPRKLLLVGLGNPTHLNTRHSVGFTMVDALARELASTSWSLKRSYPGDLATPSATLSLLKPRLAMNLNGQAVARAVKELRVDPANVIVVHDDLERELGRISLKAKGSANGHNGVRSCISSLRTDVFPRIRIGIGRPMGSEDVARYVLDPFTAQEASLLHADVYLAFRHLLRTKYDI